MIDSYACVQVPVQLVPFNPEEEDASVLWTESKDVGKGFRCIRMVNNTRVGFDAFHADKDHGGVHDTTAPPSGARARTRAGRSCPGAPRRTLLVPKSGDHRK